MSAKINTRTIDLLLLFLVLLDLILCSICLLNPPLWAQLMHGAEYNDTLGLVRRLGGVWLGFFVFQLIALIVWKNHIWWLVLVAGIRLTESFSDWVYWYSSGQHTWLGNFGLLIAPPANVLFAIILIRAFLKLSSNSDNRK